MIQHTISITNRAAHQLKRGSLWIFSNEIPGKIKALPPGTWCWFECGGQVLGTGYVNPHSLIAGRILSSEKIMKPEALLSARLMEAFEKRKKMLSRGSMRLVYSESDSLPGLMIDWYSGVVVLQSNTAGMDQVLPKIAEFVGPIFEKVFGVPLTGVVVRGDTAIRRLEGIEDFVRIVQGEESHLNNFVFEEDGLKFRANLLEGQKTGFFLDQRNNRSFLEKWVQEKQAKSILDLYSYSGGWGFRALRAGAAAVTFVDQSETALSLLKDGLDLNGFTAVQMRLLPADVFEFLHTDLGMYDVVVTDPPAFVKSKEVLPQAQKAYEKLARLAWRRVKSGGLLLSSSCSYHLAEADFMEILRSAVGKEEGRAQVLYRGSQGEDHPILLAMPETQYLKCIGLQKL